MAAVSQNNVWVKPGKTRQPLWIDLHPLTVLASSQSNATTTTARQRYKEYVICECFLFPRQQEGLEKCQRWRSALTSSTSHLKLKCPNFYAMWRGYIDKLEQFKPKTPAFLKSYKISRKLPKGRQVFQVRMFFLLQITIFSLMSNMLFTRFCPKKVISMLIFDCYMLIVTI